MRDDSHSKMHLTTSRPKLSLLLSLLYPYVAEAATISDSHSYDIFLAQTSAVCAEEFTWTQNTIQQSPCLVAAYVLGACALGDWTVPALVAGHKYDYPNASTANECSCSWSAYNLLSACTVCQNATASSWDAYAQYCGNLDTTYFPSNITLPVETAIPYWAITNPTQWPGAYFDTSEAYIIANQEHPDITDATMPANVAPHKRNIHAIVGGVVGGLLALGIIAALLAWLNLSNRRRLMEGPAPIHPYSHPMLPQRSLSTSTIRSASTAVGQMATHQAPPSGEGVAPSSPPYLRSDSMQNAGRSPHNVPEHGGLRLFNRRGGENDIEPFYANRSDSVHLDKGRAMVMVGRPVLHTVNETLAPFAVSTNRVTDANADPEFSHGHESAPINPPAYTLLPAPVPRSITVARVPSSKKQGYGHRHGSIKKGSTDSHSSSGSGASHGTGSLSRLIVPSSILESESGEGA